MSYQALNDILASSPQVYDFQKTVKLDPLDFSLKPENSAASFKDFLSSYSGDTGASDSKINEASQTHSENDNQKVKSEEKSVSEDSKEQKVEEKNSEDSTESKIDNSTNPSNSKPEITEEKIETAEVKIGFEKESEIQIKKDEIQVSKNQKNEKSLKVSKENGKNSKKIETDFTHLERIAASSNNSEIKNQKINIKEVDSEENEITFELNLESEDLISENSEIKNSDIPEDFKKLVEEESEKNNGQKEKTGLFLDKEQKISVDDQRTPKTASLNDSAKNENKNPGKDSADENNFMMQMNQENAVTENVLSLNNQSASANGSDFQAMLSNQISQNASEIVKSGSIILKDNNQGTINLVLHPDDLGNVKIHLSMDGKTLSGHIAVTTKEALQVFKENAETLREAFIKNGFDVSGFDVSLNNGSFAEHNAQEFAQDETVNYFAKRTYERSVDNFSGSSAEYSENFLENSNYSINIVA